MSREEMIHCPYNLSHVVLKSRMATHLQKCRDHYPVENYTTCPFNATHDVPAPELKYHTDTCPDRKNMESFLYLMDSQKGEEEVDLLNEQALNLEENWDNERVPESYLQAKDKVKDEPKILMAPPIGKSKSEKKAFCQSQVEKFQRGEQKKPSVDKCVTGSRLLTGVFEDEVSQKAELDTAHSSYKEEEFREVVKKSKRSGVSRGSLLRDTCSKKGDN